MLVIRREMSKESEYVGASIRFNQYPINWTNKIHRLLLINPNQHWIVDHYHDLTLIYSPQISPHPSDSQMDHWMFGCHNRMSSLSFFPWLIPNLSGDTPRADNNSLDLKWGATELWDVYSMLSYFHIFHKDIGQAKVKESICSCQCYSQKISLLDGMLCTGLALIRNGMPANYSRSGKDFLQEWSEWHCHRAHWSGCGGVQLCWQRNIHFDRNGGWCPGSYTHLAAIVHGNG